MHGVELIAKEREEQISKHGRTLDSDIRYNNHYQLSEAAALLCVPDIEADLAISPADCVPVDWDEGDWIRMMLKPYEERLVIAGALLAAEIDRMRALNNKLSDV